MYYVFLASCRSELHHLPDQGVILSGHVLISYTHTSWTVNKIASALRCVRSADQSMAAHNRPLYQITFCEKVKNRFHNFSLLTKLINNMYGFRITRMISKQQTSTVTRLKTVSYVSKQTEGHF